MSRKPISMRKIKDVLRLKFENALSDRQIAEICHIGRTTVQEYLSRARAAQLSLDQIRTLSESEVEHLLFPGKSKSLVAQPCPDWGEIHLERKKPGVTLQLLWEEYRAQHPDGYGYSRFCDLYQNHTKNTEVTMRQNHKAGDKMFVDYSGKKIEIIHPTTGEIREVEIFVAVLGASNYTYAESTMSQTIPDWIGSHVRALNYFQGVPALIVPDNLKSGVTKPWYYDPDINPTYAHFAEYYGTAVLPTRTRKPRDKAKVEAGVLLVQRWILARLRHRRFFSLGELNTAIKELLEQLNQRPFRKIQGSRKILFENLEKPALRPLPLLNYEYAEWKKATVNIDYHVEFDHHYYSVPYQRAHQKVEVRATGQTVEIYEQGQRIASHPRSREKGKHSTISEHMPPNHQFGQWTPQRLIDWARKYGEAVVTVIETIMTGKEHPEQGFRACLGILRLEKKVGGNRLNAACKRAVFFGSPRYRTVHNILENNQDHISLPEKNLEQTIPNHTNIRGPEYYQGGQKHASTPNH